MTVLSTDAHNPVWHAFQTTSRFKYSLPQSQVIFFPKLCCFVLFFFSPLKNSKQTIVFLF